MRVARPTLRAERERPHRRGPLAARIGAILLALCAPFAVLFVALTSASAGDAGAPDAAADAALSHAAVADAGDAGDAHVPGDVDALRERIAVLHRHHDAVRKLLAGSLPEELYTTELFRVSLVDEAAVEQRRATLEKRVAVRRAKAAKRAGDGGAPKKRPDAGAADGGDGGAEEREVLERELEALQIQYDDARIAFLNKPAEERKAVVAAEEQHRRLAEEQEAATVARKRAEEQAKAAEDARRKALVEAQAAREAGERALANERARVEGVRAQQAALRGELAERRRVLTTDQRDASRRAFELTQQVQEAAQDSAAADKLYDEVVAEATRARQALRQALATYAVHGVAPRYAPGGGVTPDGRAELAAQEKAIDAAADEIDAERAKLDWDLTDVAATRVAALNAQRLTLLGKATEAKRESVLGVGAEGREQFTREVEHLALMGRWVWVARSRALSSVGAALMQPLVVGSLVVRIALLAGLIALVRLVRRHGDPWLGAARAFTARALRRRIVSLPIQAVLNATRALLPEGLFLGVVLGAGYILGANEHGTALMAAYRIMVAFAAYRLSIAAAHRAIARLASTPLSSITAGRSDKILQSLRLVGRFALAVTIFLVISETTLGRGYLYHVTTRFAWLGSIPIAGILVRSWRDDISDAYLGSYGTGAFAELVRRTRVHWYGFFVAVAAFLAVLVGFAGRSARRFILGFEQSRKALAYLFRRRLEKRAVEQVDSIGTGALPPEVMAKLSTLPIEGDSYALDRYPEMDRFDRALAAWRDEGVAGALLVVGKTGYGKTSWLNVAAARASSVPSARLDLQARVDTEADLYARVSQAVGLPETRDREALAAALREGPRRLVLIDDAQNLFQRGVGTFAAWRALGELVSSTGDRVFWLLSMAHHPFEYLSWAQRGTGIFNEVVQIPAWSEREMADLLLARTNATGWDPVYEDLIVDRLEGVEAESQLVSTAQDYFRLIWDYAEGSPRVALHCWAGSLATDRHKELRVRLFRRPEEDMLEKLSDPQKFVLAAVIWHESITAEEVVRSLRYPRTGCADALRMLGDRGVLAEDAGRYRITTAWWPAVRRYLRRKHLIET